MCFRDRAISVYKQLSFPECAEMLRNAEMFFWESVSWHGV